MTPRAAVYIDGFNLFYALKRRGWRSLYWLDVEALAREMCPKDTVFSYVNYYTSRSKKADSSQRQQVYLTALGSRAVNIKFGQMEKRDIQCEAQCKVGFQRYQEKETDVSIGVEMIGDCYRGLYDSAVLVTADVDQVPTLRYLKENRPNIPRKLVFPPSATYFPKRLAEMASSYASITEAQLKRCQLEPVVNLPNGKKVSRPPFWS